MKYHLRIFFVGVCNKPGKGPLDITTVSGKMVSKIIAAFPNDEAMEYEWVRTNLFDTAVDLNAALGGPLAVRNWWRRNEVKDDDLIISLGDIVNSSFRKAKVKTCKLGHPSRMWLNADQKATYLPRAIEKIGLAIADHVSRDAESSDRFLRAHGEDPDKLVAEGVKFINDLIAIQKGKIF